MFGLRRDERIRKTCDSCNCLCNISSRTNIVCSTCSNVFHKNCLKNSSFNSYNENLLFVCGKCLIDQLPFWNLDNNEIINTFSPEDSQNYFSEINPIQLNELFDSNFSQNTDEDEFIESYGKDRYFLSNELSTIPLGQNDNFFKSFCLNIRSLQNPSHFSQLQTLINEMSIKPTAIAINETYLKSNLYGPHCNLEGYSFVSNCRKAKKNEKRKTNRGGGVGIYVKEGIDYEILSDLTIMNEKIFESIFIEITTPQKNLVYGTIYRSPNHLSIANHNFQENLRSVLEKVEKSNKQCIIQGDLNYNLLNENYNHANTYRDIFMENLFFPLISKPTRITKTSQTCIDHIWSNIFNHNFETGIIVESISDHLAPFILTDINLKNEKIQPSAKNIKSRKIDYESLSLTLNEANIENIMSSDNVNDAYGHFEGIITDSIEKSSSIIIYKSNKKNKNKWFDGELLKLKEKRDRLYKKYITKGKTQSLKTKFKEIKKRYEKLIYSKKKKYYQNLLIKQKSNMKNTWRTLNSLLGKAKRNQTQGIEINGSISHSATDIANAFNDFFINVPKKLHDELPKRNQSSYKKYLGPRFANSIFLKSTSLSEVNKLLYEMKPKHSCGYDNLSPYIIKTLPPMMCQALVHIFNLSLKNGTFISKFKIGKVIPIHKKESKKKYGEL